jgi:hypothetical protein
MTIQKQLSHLSFAAIMLVFAALPALAQTGSDNQTAVATTSNLVESEQVVALSKDRVRIPTKESPIVVAPAVKEKQPSFSATQFLKSATEPAMITDSKVFKSTSLENPGEAFNQSSSKSIYFIPSRGPKLPWQQ